MNLDWLPQELDDIFYRYRVAKNNGERRKIEQEFVTYVQKQAEDAYDRGFEMSRLTELNKTNGVILNGITYRKGDLTKLHEAGKRI